MMMPANYSAVAENEMTYVVGGGVIEFLGSFTAPIWTVDNLKTFNTNLITVVGNSFIDSFLKNTVGYVFGGNATWKGLGTAAGNLVGVDKFKAGQIGDGIAAILGNVAAIYNLGRKDVKNYAGESTHKFDIV